MSLLEDLNFKGIKNWPKYDESYLEKNEVEIVIQINGKKRSKIMLEKDTSEALVLEKVKKDEKVIKNLDNKLIFKHIYVKNRLINLILK